jgi:hypothetical protein
MRKRNEVVQKPFVDDTDATAARLEVEGHEEDPKVGRQVAEAAARDRSEYKPPLPSRDSTLEDLTDNLRSVKPGGGNIFVNADGSTTVALNWGEEMFSPIPGSYSKCSVGPFGLTFNVPAGLDIDAAMKLGSRALENYATIERERKLRNFVNKLQQIQGEVKST